jgi:inosine-uridine nucleoside N-ribohydrolase
MVLSSSARITILNGHVASDAVFVEDELMELSRRKGHLYRFIESSTADWVKNMNSKFGIKGFCNWDMAAAIFLNNKDLFTKDTARINPDIKKLKKGNLNLDNTGIKEIVMPKKILDIKKFNSLIFQTFESFNKKYGT